ncbi:hypothetical protein GLOTRDRAFT_134273 [Gloeophyllum trabeum ATCC 11539]|uniref:Uncharacterized protein n=1 Tax=Gloeophyllum trabeum (strain ATCC 11539 / FP-39264 / Madison 617) TaxID=670483 RepID=S7PRS7_GLOTA|nr:uncharacterized protein GLOTRDRAFT_134273 [Gloeophyllum trabeum ATCC 11539]EPQ50083.1 hypothetical protein GLOTRDRAFT_134273 [Gloeophyllum trabeum ATCC 11539]
MSVDDQRPYIRYNRKELEKLKKEELVQLVQLQPGKWPNNVEWPPAGPTKAVLRKVLLTPRYGFGRPVEDVGEIPHVKPSNDSAPSRAAFAEEVMRRQSSSSVLEGGEDRGAGWESSEGPQDAAPLTEQREHVGEQSTRIPENDGSLTEGTLMAATGQLSLSSQFETCTNTRGRHKPNEIHEEEQTASGVPGDISETVISSEVPGRAQDIAHPDDTATECQSLGQSNETLENEAVSDQSMVFADRMHEAPLSQGLSMDGSYLSDANWEDEFGKLNLHDEGHRSDASNLNDTEVVMLVIRDLRVPSYPVKARIPCDGRELIRKGNTLFVNLLDLVSELQKSVSRIYGSGKVGVFSFDERNERFWETVALLNEGQVVVGDDYIAPIPVDRHITINVIDVTGTQSVASDHHPDNAPDGRTSAEGTVSPNLTVDSESSNTSHVTDPKELESSVERSIEKELAPLDSSTPAPTTTTRVPWMVLPRQEVTKRVAQVITQYMNSPAVEGTHFGKMWKYHHDTKNRQVSDDQHIAHWKFLEVFREFWLEKRTMDGHSETVPVLKSHINKALNRGKTWFVPKRRAYQTYLRFGPDSPNPHPKLLRRLDEGCSEGAAALQEFLIELEKEDEEGYASE